MPKVVFPFSKERATVYRSVIREVVKDIIRKTGFPENTSLVFQEDEGGPRKLNSLSTKCMPHLRTQYENYVFIENEETVSEEDPGSDVFGRREHPYVFADPNTGTYARTLFTGQELILNLRFRASNMTTLNEWCNRIRYENGIRNLVRNHNIYYDYALPYGVVDFIAHAYELKEQTAPMQMSVAEYKKAYFCKGQKNRSNVSKTHQEMIIEEIQHGVQGFSDINAVYDAVTISESLYEVAFTYKVLYRRPYAMELTFPPMIHNEFIDKRFLQWLPKEPEHEEKGYFPFDHATPKREKFQPYYRGDGGTRFLDYDEWFPEEPYALTRTLTICPIKVDLNDPRAVFNLAELQDAKLIDPIVVEYMRDYHERGLTPNQSHFVFELFEVGKEEDKIALDVLPDLSIVANVDMNPRKRNYLRISINLDLVRLPNNLEMELLEKPDMFFKIAKILDPNVTMSEERGADLELMRGGLAIKEVSYLKWLKTLPYVNPAFNNAPGNSMRTVSIISPTVTGRK